MGSRNCVNAPSLGVRTARKAKKCGRCLAEEKLRSAAGAGVSAVVAPAVAAPAPAAARNKPAHANREEASPPPAKRQRLGEVVSI